MELTATASIATADTDAEISQRERQKGHEARVKGFPRRANPWNGGLCEGWWNEGYDGYLGPVTAQISE